MMENWSGGSGEIKLQCFTGLHGEDLEVGKSVVVGTVKRFVKLRVWNCDSSLILWSSPHALPRRNQERTLIKLNLLWVEALNSHALLKKRIYYSCGKNFYTIALNPLMCLDIWHTRTIWNKFHFTCILNKLFHVALLSIYIYLPLSPA